MSAFTTPHYQTRERVQKWADAHGISLVLERIRLSDISIQFVHGADEVRHADELLQLIQDSDETVRSTWGYE